MTFAKACKLTEDQARQHLESLRWPNGAICVHCGSENVCRLDGKATRPGVYKCRERGCRKQFTVTVGTIFERSHIPLNKWGNLPAILQLVGRRLKPGGRVVANLAVLERSHEAYHQMQQLGFQTELVMVNAARGKELRDGTVRLESLNPIFVVSGVRPGDSGE